MPLVERLQTQLSSKSDAKDETTGFFLSILLVAHTAANAIINDDDKKARSRQALVGLDSKLDLLLGGEVSNESTNSGTKSPTARGLSMDLLTSNVHFEPIHELPLLTLGNGNLLLLHFDNKKRKVSEDVTRTSISVPVTPDLASTRLSVSGSLDTKVVRRISISNGATEERPVHDDETIDTTADGDDNASDFTDDINGDLDQILDSANVEEASNKRNREFHQVFPKIPASERLSGEFSCALSKDILVQGRMYLLQHYICFKSNILGWVTLILIPLQEVIQIEKKSTAVLFPNGIIIRTLHQKYVFATFLLRDGAFNLITKVWHNALQGNPGDETRKRANTRSRGRNSVDDTISGLDSSDVDAGLGSINASTNVSLDDEPEAPTRRPSRNKNRNSGLSDGVAEDLPADTDNNVSTKGESPLATELFNGFKNPGPMTHSPTKYEYTKDSNDTEIVEASFKAPLGVVYELLFGDDNSTYVKILQNQKNFDILTSDIHGISNSNKDRDYTYTKPLGGPIGPKQTKCIITDTVRFCDFSKYVEVEQVTQSPDVPSGSSFKVKTRLFFSWGPDNSTKMFVVTTIEWSAKSWIKGAIEKGSIDGQKESMKVLIDTLTDTISAGGGSSSSTKRRRRKTKSSQAALPTEVVQEPPKPLTLTEQLTKLFETIGGVSPIKIPMVSDALIGILVVVVLSLMYSFVLAKMLGGGGLTFQVTDNGDPFTKLVKFDGHNYFLIPSSDTYMSNQKSHELSEARLWDWVNERSHGRLSMKEPPLQNSDYDRFMGQEFEEVVRIAKKRVDQLYDQLDVNQL